MSTNISANYNNSKIQASSLDLDHHQKVTTGKATLTVRLALNRKLRELESTITNKINKDNN